MLPESASIGSVRETINWISVLNTLQSASGHPLDQTIHEGIALPVELKGSLGKAGVWQEKVCASSLYATFELD